MIKHWSTKAIRDPWGVIQKPAVIGIWVFTPDSSSSYCMSSSLINWDNSLDAVKVGISISRISSICKIQVRVWLNIRLEEYILQLIWLHMIFFSKFLVDVRSDSYSYTHFTNHDILFKKSKYVTISLYTKLLLVVQINLVVGEPELASQ